MHFQRLDVDLDARTILDAEVGDDGVYADATVQWSGYSRGDRSWLFKRLEQLLSIWAPGAAPDKVSLRGHMGPSGPVYALEGLPEAPAWDELSDAERAAVLVEVDLMLESVHGLLLIL